MARPIRTTLCLIAALTLQSAAAALAAPPSTHERMAEWTIESQKKYADAFNDVEVDVIFSKDERSWRVPAFWRGGEKWTVRFAPPAPGEYRYRLESTDRNNPDLNGQEGKITIGPYRGSIEMLRRGSLRLSTNKRYFEHADGTPFYWLGDTWWMGLSTRLSWEDYRKLTADRKTKGFTVVQLVAGLVPFEELGPLDPGFQNEGGPVWEADYARINPKYFDAADRRIEHLLESGMAPAIFGAWNRVLAQTGVKKMKQHWRYLIARYGAYPVFWVLGGEILDPPPRVLSRLPQKVRAQIVPGWTEIARYVRAIDPYHHPLSVHEAPPSHDFPLQDEQLSDFDMVQSSHGSWSSIAAEVAQLNLHYARTSTVKPIVQGEIGYETLGEQHFSDFQRAAFWLAMLNGSAGFTYGANGTWESYSADKPLHRLRWSFLSWEEGMNLPGSYQVGLGAKLLRQYRWWQFAPHPEWVTPRGTTLLEPHEQINDFDLGEGTVFDGPKFPAGLWKKKGGDFTQPYAAGIPGEVRVIYTASFGLIKPTPPTILRLEPGVRYQAYLWEPTLGIRLDLGAVERPTPAAKVFADSFAQANSSAWMDEGAHPAIRGEGVLTARGQTLSVLKKVRQTNIVAQVDAAHDAPAALVLRYRDLDNYVAAVYSPEKKSLYLLDRRQGVDGDSLGQTPVPQIGPHVQLSAEVRDDKGIASLTDGQRVYTTPIVNLATTASGRIGVLHQGAGVQRFDDFEVRGSPTLVKDESLPRKLYDAQGHHRGDLVGAGIDFGYHQEPGWDSFGRDKHILLDAYRPERVPSAGDWVLVLETQRSRIGTR